MELIEEQQAIQELMTMTEDELLLVEFEVVKWVCQGKNCCNGTKVRDYGIAPIYYNFFDVNKYFWMCGKHAKIFKRLKKNFPIEKIDEKIFDFNKTKIIQIPDPKSTKKNNRKSKSWKKETF